MQPFEWQRLLLGEDMPATFIFEIVFRTLVMYITMVVFFKVSGKKEIKQLSIFDLILIVGLGSAAGDPMFYHDVPLLHGLAVFGTIFILYYSIIRICQKNEKINEWLEGGTDCVFDGNSLNIKILHKEGLNTAELFSEVRQESVEHLGQVKKIYLEFSGEFSVYYHKDEDVVPGLPIWPELLKSGKAHIDAPGHYSCTSCGNTVNYDQPKAQPTCTVCNSITWVQSKTDIRIR